MITLDILQSVYPSTSEATLAQYVEPMNALFALYQIDTVNRQASFIAQVGHESGGFRHTLENLNYSSQGLRKTFRKYFTIAQADAYARQPERIANRVYANRMGNGNEASGDGWKYRGKGLIQLTGANNHKAFALFMEMTVDDAILYLKTPEGALMSAVWFWKSNGLNDYADRGDMLGQTRRINGGTNGLQDRVSHYGKLRLALRA